MDILIDWLPRAGAAITILLGLVGFFKPQLITNGQQITLGSPMALSDPLAFGHIPGVHLDALHAAAG